MDRPLFPILSNSTNCPEPTRTAKSPPARPRKSSKRGRQPENPQSKSSNLDDGLSVEGELSQQNRTVASVEPLRLNGNREEMVEACCGTVTEEDQEEEDTITMPDGVWADRELQQEEEVEQLEGKMPMDDLEAEIRLLSRQSSQATVHPNSGSSFPVSSRCNEIKVLNQHGSRRFGHTTGIARFSRQETEDDIERECYIGLGLGIKRESEFGLLSDVFRWNGVSV